MKDYVFRQHEGIDPTTGLPQIKLDRYDVVRGYDRKVMNEGPLTLRAAKRLAIELQRKDDSVDIDRHQGKKQMSNNQNDEKIRWRKFGKGSFRMANGRIIKPGQVFIASPSEIPEGFRDTIVALDELPEEKPLEVVEGNYRIKSRGPGWYDVLDSQGKKVNEQALRQDEAKALLESLMG